MSHVTFPKPEKLKTVKGRKRRAEKSVKTVIREIVAERDGYCRLAKDGMAGCQGESEWAHLPGTTRAQTRGMKPERRHTTAGTVMACTRHHDHIDGRRAPKIRPELGPYGADGEISWRLGVRVAVGQ